MDYRGAELDYDFAHLHRGAYDTIDTIATGHRQRREIQAANCFDKRVGAARAIEKQKLVPSPDGKVGGGQISENHEARRRPSTLHRDFFRRVYSTRPGGASGLLAAVVQLGKNIKPAFITGTITSP